MNISRKTNPTENSDVAPLKRRRFLQTAIVMLMAVLSITQAPAASAVAAQSLAPPSYPDVAWSYSADGQWRLKLDASTINLYFAKEIGAEATTQHREWACSGLFCWGGHTWQWVDRNASYLTVSNSYTPFPPQYGNCDPGNPRMCAPAAPPRACAGSNTSSVSCFDWAFFITFNVSTGQPGAGQAPLNIKGVRSTARAVLPGGQSLFAGPVDDAFWF